MAEPINVQLHEATPNMDGSTQPAKALHPGIVSTPFVYDPAARTLHWGAHDEIHHSDLWPHMTTEHEWAGPIGHPGFVSHGKNAVQFYDPQTPDREAIQQAMGQHLGYEPVDMDTVDDEEALDLWHTSNTVDEEPHHINPYTGLPCNCHWGKPKRLKWRIASQNVRKIRNEDRKIFRDEDGQNFLTRLEQMSDSYEIEPMVDWFASQYKKGNMKVIPSYHGGHTINYRGTWEEYNPDWEGHHVDNHILDWKQWMDARQHPLRRGVNIMEKTPAEVHALSKQLQDELAEKEKRDNWAHYHSDNGEHLHTFRPEDAENEFDKDLLERYKGWQVHGLTNTDHAEAESAALGHCIGDSGQPYRQAIHDGTIKAFSLRDRTGYPKTTWHQNEDGSLAHVQGRSGYPDEDRRHLISMFNEKYGHDDDNGGEGQEHEMEPAEDAEYHLGDPSDYDEYLEQFHPEGSPWELASQDYEANIGENTELIYGDPNWDGIIQSLHRRGDENDAHNVIHTVLNQGHEVGFDNEINEWRKEAEKGNLEPDESELIDRWDHAYNQAKSYGKPDSPNRWEQMGRPEPDYDQRGTYGVNRAWAWHVPTPIPGNPYNITKVPTEHPPEEYFQQREQERTNKRLFQQRVNPEHEDYDPILHQQVQPPPGQNPLFTERRNPYDTDPDTNIIGWNPTVFSRRANILDPVHDTLPPEIWDDPGSDTPRLKPVHRKWIMSEIMNMAQKFHDHPEQWCQLVLTGSLTTYQYSEASDCDVSLFVDPHFLPEWDRAKLIAMAIDNIDGELLPGTPYQMQCFVVAKNIAMSDLYQPGLRSGYDIIQNKWIVPPDKSRTHDVQREYNANWVYALESADKMERLLRYEPSKAVDFWHQIHRRRMRDQRAGKGDFSQANVVYKFLANRGLFPSISEASGEYIASLTNGHRPGTLVGHKR